MLGISSNLNPNIVKTALDDVFFQEWNVESHPGYVDQSSDMVFNQDSVDSAAEIMEIFKGVDTWNSRQEEENVDVDNARFDNKITFTVSNYDKEVQVPKIWFDDQKHGAYEGVVRDFARKGRITQKKEAFAFYRGAFDTYSTADGSYVCSDSHTTVSGETVDNKMTSALSPSALKTAIKMMVEQKDQAGVIGGNMPNTLLVAPHNYDYACEITKSQLKADTANNNVNPYSMEYNLNVVTSEWLGAAAGGDDNYWFLLGANKSVTRWTREEIWTGIVDYIYSSNNVYRYKGGFREMVGAPDYVGIIGSTGAS